MYPLQCKLCSTEKKMESEKEFATHLRANHCIREGGSFICRYGENNVCTSLPMEGVSNADYEQHVYNYHLKKKKKLKHNPSKSSLESSICAAKWNYYLASQNLSTVLNDPKKPKPKDFFTKHWGDEFVDTHHISEPHYLPNIQKCHFESYLKKIKNILEDISFKIDNRKCWDYQLRTFDEFRLFRSENEPTGLHPGVQKLALSNVKTLEKYKKRISNDGYSNGKDHIVNLSLIPDVFLRDDFNLCDASTFRLAYPNLLERNKDDPSLQFILSNNYQEQLSRYMDEVEVQISQQVSQKSDAFFHTMTSHDVLMEQLTKTISKISLLRNKIQTINKNLVIDPLRVINFVRSRNNYVSVLHKLLLLYNIHRGSISRAPTTMQMTDSFMTKQTDGKLLIAFGALSLIRKLRIMSTVTQTHATVKLLLSTNDYVGALDLIYATKDLLNNELSGLLCFRHLSSELDEKISIIEKSMLDEFVRYVSADLNRPLHEEQLSSFEQDKLSFVIIGLLRLVSCGERTPNFSSRKKGFNFLECYVREANTSIETVIKQCEIEVVSNSESSALHNDSMSLSDQIGLLSIGERLTLLENVATSLTRVLSRVVVCYCAMRDAARACSLKTRSSVKNNASKIESLSENFIDDTNYDLITKEMNAKITCICEYTLDSYAQLMPKKCVLMSEPVPQNQLLDLQSAVEGLGTMFDELSSNDMLSSQLRTRFKEIIDGFVKKFHSERLNKLSLLLETECWKPSEVPSRIQKLVDNLHSTGKFQSVKLVDDEPASPTLKCLMIGNEEFVAIGTVLLLVNIVSEYCFCSEELPVAAGMLLRNVRELLQMFNSKSCKLVLGAEAVNPKTGLSRITSANLALLFRALQLLLWLIPLLRQHFTQVAVSVTRSHFASLDQLTDQIRSHIRDVDCKLLYIASQSITVELRGWEAKPPIPSKSFVNLSKDLKKIYEAICDILPRDDVRKLFEKINSTFKDILREHVVRLNIKNDGGPQHGLVTTELVFYLQNLKKAKIFADDELTLDAMLDNIW